VLSYGETRVDYEGTRFVSSRLADELLRHGCQVRIPTVALRFYNIFRTRQALSNPYTGVLAEYTAARDVVTTFTRT
jgi:dTDP-L-rhamnose 4-epimerase